MDSKDKNREETIYYPFEEDKDIPGYSVPVKIDTKRGTLSKEKCEEYLSIVSTFLFYDYDQIVEKLITENEFAATREQIYVDNKDLSIIRIRLFSHDSSMTIELEKGYSIPEFLEIMQQLKNNELKKAPENRELIKACSDRLERHFNSLLYWYKLDLLQRR